MKLDESVVEKIIENGIVGSCPDLDLLRDELRKLDLVVKPGDYSQSFLIDVEDEVDFLLKVK